LPSVAYRIVRPSTLQGGPWSSKIDRCGWPMADHDAQQTACHAFNRRGHQTCHIIGRCPHLREKERQEELSVSVFLRGGRGWCIGKLQVCALFFACASHDLNSNRSVGFMPGNRAQPKHNQAFPALTRAAFVLERAMYPNRPSSSTIAVNRNAQFRRKPLTRADKQAVLGP